VGEEEQIAESAARLRRKILALEQRPDLGAKIEQWLDPTEPYAGFSFDTAGDNPHFEVTADDVLALNFLDVPIHTMPYRRLMELRPEMSSVLRKLSPHLHLWHLTPINQAYRDATALWSVVTSVAGMGPTRASALMARKRPHLIPLWDRWSADFYGRSANFWLSLGRALRDADLRSAVEGLRPPGLDTTSLSLLRILDIAVWMDRGRPAPSVHTQE
jgi:hypothetical protein